MIEGVGEVKGFLFVLHRENKKAYIYEVYVNDFFSHYEVFEKRTVSDCIDFKKRLYSETNKHEIYPKAKDFGLWAWTFKMPAAANSKFNKINNVVSVKLNGKNPAYVVA